MAGINRMTFLMAISEITPQIFISGQIAATLEQVQKLGITYIVNVALESSPIVYPPSVKLEKFDILDFPNSPISNYFNSLTDKIHAHLTANKHHKVLVHCMAGISRSTTIVIAYLMRYLDMTLREAYLTCKKHRPICFPNLGFWNQLIAYENQLKRENSVKMISTQYGNVPDVAFEEIKQYTAQQQQARPAPLSTASSTTTTSNLATNTSVTQEFMTSQTRSTGRDSFPSHSTGLTRSRSLAAQPNARPSVAAASTYVSNPAYQTPIFGTNKQAFLTPTRLGAGRLLNNGVSSQGSFSSVPPTYSSHRHIPVSIPANVKHRYTPQHQHQHQHQHHHHHHHQMSSGATNPVRVTPNTEQRRAYYDTTYRSSFIKPYLPQRPLNMSGISEVVDNLYISGMVSHTAILNKGIRSVINISSDCPRLDLGPTVEYEKISIPDIPTASIQIYFDRLADQIERNLQQGKKTLVHCYVGRSRSASIILAYLMKHKQMTLRDAFYYLRSRRPIIGPNFGFIRQLMAYEKSLFGYTSVSFIDTPYDSIPDIYLPTKTRLSFRRPITRTPLAYVDRAYAPMPKSTSFLYRSPTNPLPILSSPSFSSSLNYRPLSSKSFMYSSFLHDLPGESRYQRAFEPTDDPFLSPRYGAFRGSTYVPPVFNRYYLP